MASISPEGLRNARETPNVLKVKLAQLREANPTGLVIVVEGKEDVLVYELWIKQVDQNMEWEPLVSKGKKCLLGFRALLGRDQTNLRRGTFFICDHDYDALRGYPPGDDIYVLPGYSVENFVATGEVFNSVLRTVFQMHGDTVTRQKYLEQFDFLRERFIALVEPCCAELYASKLQDVGNVAIDDDLNRYFLFGARDVFLREGADLGRVVTTEKPIDGNSDTVWAKFIDGKAKQRWVRGKFLLYCFVKICRALFDDWNSKSPMFGDGGGAGLRINPSSFSLEMLAARASLPNGFGSAVSRWASGETAAV